MAASLTRTQIKNLPNKAVRRQLELAAAAARQDEFFGMLERARLPIPVAEHRFRLDRKWQFDYAWLDKKVALEVEGGVWTAGRHTRGQGFLNDIEKYNSAVVLGWRLLRTTPDRLVSLPIETALRKVLR